MSAGGANARGNAPGFSQRFAARILVVVAGALALGAVVDVQPAAAHPLGNFTVNQYAGLRVGAGEIRVDHIVDMAELPTFQTRSTDIDRDHNGTVTPAERAAFATATCDRLVTTTKLEVGGRVVKLAVAAKHLTFPPGSGGLETLRLECDLRGAQARAENQTDIRYRGDAFPDRIGWREVTAVGDGVTLRRTDVPRKSPSQRLTVYPSDLLSSPPNVRAANLTMIPGGPQAEDADTTRVEALGASARGVDTLTRAFTDLIGRPQLTVAFGILAVFIAVALGAAHALAPGHGKSVMAAFLVGERGSFRQAGVIAMTVTITHTAGVLVLGIVLTTSVVLAPQRVYAWLGVLSGVLLAGVGGTLFRRAWQGRQANPHHHHGPGHDHGHDHGTHDHGHHHDHGKLPKQMGLRGLIAMGFAGGLVPSPSALVVLLGAVALGRTWFGVLLVLGYGAGMACTLTGVGFALARWRSVLERRGTGRFATLLRRTVPVATASLIVLVGLGLASQAVIALGTT